MAQGSKLQIGRQDVVTFKVGGLDAVLSYHAEEDEWVMKVGDLIQICLDNTPDASLFANVRFSKSEGYSGFKEIENTPEGTIVKVEYDENGVAKEVNVVI